MKHSLFLLLAICFLLPCASWAQKQKETTVHGSDTYIVGENDNITLSEAKHRCIELAKAKAIKAVFGELVTSDVIDSYSEANGEKASSYFWENTVAMAKGIWLGDTKKPVVNATYEDDKLVFTAEVWGRAREIVQSQVDLKWEVLTRYGGELHETSDFKSGNRVFVRFRSPADGYVAIYLITGDDETECLLPYRENPKGQHPIKRGTDYLFFDKEEDSSATQYNLNTKHEMERNQLVIIYSKRPFTKCNDITGDAKHPNSLSTADFQKWLLKCQRADADMIISKKWVTIRK